MLKKTGVLACAFLAPRDRFQVLHTVCPPSRMSTGLIHIDLTDTVGALLIGTLFSVFLFGMVTLQTHLYYTLFREDHWSTKALVRL